MIRFPHALILGFGLAAALSTAAFAHHSYGMFDPSKTIMVSGTVKTFEWTNPHIRLYLNADTKAGAKPDLWIFEWGSPGTERRMGWNKDTIKPGDKVVVTGHPVRTADHAGQLQSVSMNGKEIGHLRSKTDTEKPGLD